ncbi:MAG: DUF3748 domain-containing protein [Bacteroidales bacterium]|nr:DUF3748 domain-containing protein [Bacteroidales bacterium]
MINQTSFAMPKVGIHPVIDARDIIPPYTPGALRGGTHAHSWSPGGKWVSFTYNDVIIKNLENSGVIGKQDLRMVDIMAPFGKVRVSPEEYGENIDGEMFTYILTQVHEKPVPGTDMIDRAYEEGWVGKHGYRKSDGSRQKHAIAFLGDRKYPGIQGPRHWVQSMPDGSFVFFMMRDDEGLVQIYGISPNGGEIRQFTFNSFSAETTFTVRPYGEYLAYGNQERVFITGIKTGVTHQISPDPAEGSKGLRYIVWSNDGNMLAFNRKIDIEHIKV